MSDWLDAHDHEHEEPLGLLLHGPVSVLARLIYEAHADAPHELAEAIDALLVRLAESSAEGKTVAACACAGAIGLLALRRTPITERWVEVDAFARELVEGAAP